MKEGACSNAFFPILFKLFFDHNWAILGLLLSAVFSKIERFSPLQNSITFYYYIMMTQCFYNYWKCLIDVIYQLIRHFSFNELHLLCLNETFWAIFSHRFHKEFRNECQKSCNFLLVLKFAQF